MTQVNEMSTLIKSLTETFNGLQNMEVEAEHAREVSRLSGKIISSCKTQLDYNKYMKIKKPIDFLQ